MKGWMGLAVTVAVAGMPLMAQGRVSTQTNAASARSSMAVGEPVYFSETQSEGFVMPIAGPIREFEPLTDFDADFLADIEQALAKQRIASSAQTKQTDAASEVLLSAEGSLEAGDEIFGEDSRVDWYEFQGEAGQVVMLTIESEDFTPFAGLFETTTDGAEAVASATSADGNTATVVVTLPNSSRYIVAAIAANEAPGEGSYRLSVTIASAAVGRQAEQQTEADRLFQQGIQQHRTSQFHSAIQSWQQALEIYRTIGNRQGEANSLGNLGLVYLSLGQYQRAIEFHQQSLDIDRDIGNRQGEANSLGNLGLAYHSLGQYQRAIEFHQQTLAIARDISDRQGEAASLGNLGLAYDALDQYQRAIEFHQQTLAIARDIGDRQGEANSLGNLGLAYDALGQYQRAIEFQEQSLAIARDIGDRQGEAASLGNLGLAYDALGQYQRAIEFQQQSLDIDRDIGDRQSEALSLNNLGGTYIKSNQLAEAETVLRQSVEVYEALRVDLSDAQLIAIADTQARTYNNLEIVLIAQNKTIEALAITERGRAQAFALQLALRQGESADTVTYPSVTDIQRIAVEQNTTLVEYSLTRDRQALFIWVISPAGDIQFRQVSLSDLFTDTLTAFIQQTRDSLGVRGSRTTAAPQLRPDMIARLQAETDQNLKDLHNLLIEPIADLLPTDSDANVVFVPQGELFLVPFPALKDTDGTYLIEKHTISTAPSIQVLGLTNETSPSTPLRELPLPCLLRRRCANDSAQGAVLVGNPTMPTVTIPDANGLQEVQLSSLPGAQREAQAIGEFLNITPLIGDQATEAQVKAQLPNVDLIHLATHGLLEYGDPQALAVRDFPGAIALAPGNGEDGLLTASEILDMELQANLAVLSACDTGRGRITGDGVVGLSRALITAGVPSVVVSLWAVPDAPTAALMSEFYRQLDQGHSKAQALRQAMLITLEQSPDPKDWAAFTLIGAME